MNPYQQQPYGPPGYVMPPTTNYYGPGYQPYGGMPNQAPGGPYGGMPGAAPGYPAQPMPQGYPTTGYAYPAPLPYGTAPYPSYPQAPYPGPAPGAYNQQPNCGYQGQYGQSAYGATTSVTSSGPYPAPIMSDGYPSAPPDPSSTSNASAPEISTGYCQPGSSDYNPFASNSTGIYSGSHLPTNVTDSSAKTKPDRPPPPQMPIRDPPSPEPRPRPGSPDSWGRTSPAQLPTPKPRVRGNSPSAEMGDRSGDHNRVDDNPEKKRKPLVRQGTADEWNAIANEVEKEKKKSRPSLNTMDPNQLSGISDKDPSARADYKQKLNALAGLMTDVNLDDSSK